MTRVGGDSTQGGVPENYYMPYFAVCPPSEYFINSIKPASARAGSILRRSKLSSNFRFGRVVQRLRQPEGEASA